MALRTARSDAVMMLSGTPTPQRRARSLPIFFFQAEDGIRDLTVTGVQTCALPILLFQEGCQEDDLDRYGQYDRHEDGEPEGNRQVRGGIVVRPGDETDEVLIEAHGVRSEERRGGEECRSRWSPYH